MKDANELFQEIVEGNTKLLVPTKSLTEKVPPIKPAFFNPKAKTNRDFSIIAYAAFLKKFEGPKIFLESLSGVGARGLRVANELEIEKMKINLTLGVDFRACENYTNGFEAAKKLDLPTLSILADKDRMCRLKDGKKLADHIKGSDVHVIKNCGHMMLLEEADQTLA